MYNLRVVAVLTSNDDGSEAAIVTSDQVQLSMTMANPLYNPYGVNFIFDPTTDVEHRQSTLLNHDSDRNDGQIYTHPNTEPFFSGDSHNQERNSIAQQFAGRLVVYFNSGDRYYWDKTQNRWVYGPRGYNWSNDKDSFVTMTGNDGGSLDFAHEVGHYLHLAHTFSGFPGTIAEAAASIKSFVEEAHNPKERGADVFDGDLPTGVTDTPPDPGSQLFKNPCDPNETSTTIPVKFTDGSSREYVISPDRENIMNYWDKTCRGKPAHISPGQAVRVLDALRTGNRNHLIAPTVLYDAVWENGDRGQTRALAWSLNDFSVRLKDELGQGRHCMQAYDVGGNQIRYDGVWEPGGTGQDGVNAWTLNDFAAKFDAETSAQRHVLLMQAYNIGGGQIRYDAIFEAGDRRQTRALGWAFNDFATRHREESAKGHRLIHMQACDVGSGQIRYDGVWEPSANQQEFAFAYAQHDLLRNSIKRSQLGSTSRICRLMTSAGVKFDMMVRGMSDRAGRPALLAGHSTIS